MFFDDVAATSAHLVEQKSIFVVVGFAAAAVDGAVDGAVDSTVAADFGVDNLLFAALILQLIKLMDPTLASLLMGKVTVSMLM